MIQKNRKILALLLFVFFGLSIGLSLLFYTKTEQYALQEAQNQGKNILYAHRAVQTYITKNLRPELFSLQTTGLLNPEYFSPVIFSSTYIARNITALLNEERRNNGLTEIYFKLASDNPRNPINQADPAELDLLKRINSEGLKNYSQMIDRPDGKWLYMAVPTQPTDLRCLKCHGDPANAPKDLVRLYGNKAGFFEKDGRYRALISIRVPLAPVLSKSQNLFFVLTAITLTCLALIYLMIFLFIRHLDAKQQSLNQTAQRLELALKSGHYGIWDWDIRNDILVWDDRMLELYGVNKDSFKVEIEKWENTLHPLDRPIVMTAIKAALDGKKDFDTSFRILRHDGVIKFIKAEGLVLRDINGDAVRMIGLSSDITESKEALRSLDRAANEWQAAMDASDDAIYLLSLDRKLLRANKTFYLSTGETPETSLGRYISEIIHPDYSGPCTLCKAEVDRHDFITVLEADHPDNHIGRPVEVAIKMVRDNSGEPISILVTRHDLTFDRKIQEVLGETEERYRQLVELSQDIILILSEGKIIFINDAGVRMFCASSPNELLLRPMMDLIHPDSRVYCINLLDGTARQSGKLPVMEVKYVRLDGTTFFGEVTATSMLHKGKPALHVFVRDITGRKNLEDQLRHSQKMEAVGHLAGGIAHDFNNILTVIGGYGSLLEMKLSQDDPNKEMVDQILASTERAANLTRGLLAFSRKQEMSPQYVNINELIQGVGKFLRRVIGEHITLTTTLRNDPITVFVDKGQIEQVLVNLATNARDVMENGGTLSIETQIIEIDNLFVEVHGFGSPGKYAQITVSDDGLGMNDVTKSKIFEPFFTTKETGKGTGLGLAIVYGIVNQHNGHIDVYSEPGKGTAFKIYLPMSDNQQSREGENISFESPVMGSETILVVEDEEPVRNLVETILKQYGYNVILAEDGEDGVDKFLANRDKISLIFTDLIMPKKSGKELFDEVRAVEPEMKILFTSGYTADMLHKKGNIAEHFDIVKKPITPLELAKKVRDMLDAF
jgi:PAS domain S-box-containing protein